MGKRELEMITVVCFLWGKWCFPHGIDYVNKLFRGVKRNLSIRSRFVCFTDYIKNRKFEMGVEILPLDVPNWKWNLRKMLLYKPNNGLVGRVLAFDLDVVITGSLDNLANYQGDFATCEGAYRPGKMGGSLLGFNAGSNGTGNAWCDILWNPLVNNPRRVENKTGGSERRWLSIQLKNKNIDFWQRMYPGQVLSYKVDCQNGLPEGARVVRFHGQPRPHEVKDNWVKEYWV